MLYSSRLFMFLDGFSGIVYPVPNTFENKKPRVHALGLWKSSSSLPPSSLCVGDISIALTPIYTASSPSPESRYGR